MSTYVPTIEINKKQLKNLIYFIGKHEDLLAKYGAIKIKLNENWKLNLKKKVDIFSTNSVNKQLVKIPSKKFIYPVEEINSIEKPFQEKFCIQNENDFLNLLNSSKYQQLNISYIMDESFFLQKTSIDHFSVYHSIYESTLKFFQKDIQKQFHPYIRRTHKSPSIFPLNCAQQFFFTLDYHRQGENHHWYIIPSHQRCILQDLLSKQNQSNCLEHQQIFLHPLFFYENNIQYYRINQQENEFVILSSGTFYQSFTEN
ncbi:unnamed protein product [Adineta ricciae]|uniref:JmjN domain-containing protein n=1 Tax=Adineta ricciae TaxID=249248 RepID=A0A815RRZ0_ADIRI|nr:unnamed protein product [Adineta ricciae]